MIRLLIVDDSELDRDGLKVSLIDEPDLEIVGEAENGIEAVEMAHQLKPNVVLTDLKLPYKSAIEAIGEICAADPPPFVIALTTYATDREVGAALKAGAKAYVRKDAPLGELLRAIRTGGGGPSSSVPIIQRAKAGTGGNTAASRRAPDPFFDKPRPGSDLFSDPELNIFDLLVQGRTNAQIAQSLAIEEKEVRDTALKIYKELGVKDRSGLLSIARRIGMIK